MAQADDLTIILSAVDHIILEYQVDDIMPYLLEIHYAANRIASPKLSTEDILNVSDPSDPMAMFFG